MRGVLAICLIGVLAAGVAPNAHAQGDAEAPLLGPALSALFNPRTAPAQKTMGLLQRSFLDLVEESQPKLEIAFVIDGTDSMSGQLESVRESLAAMMNDLELYKEHNISYQIVVYRDTGAPSGPVELPLHAANNNFVADRAAVLAAIKGVKAETGAPYFPELVDEGLRTALADLPWSADDGVSRWIFLFGDAPPFDESFSEPQNRASRHVGTAALASLAQEKGVRINSILCNSDPEDAEAHEKLLDQTRRFMSALSTNSGGLMLDLSYPDIRAAIRSAATKPSVDYERIGVIRKEEVEQARREAETTAAAPLTEGGRVRVAILPHLPLDQMTFDPQNEAVQLARELRIRLRALPGVEFKDSATIKDRYRLVSRQGVQGEAMLQMLATALDVDYVLWGTLSRTGGAVEATTGVYDRTAGRRLAEAKTATNPTAPASRLGAELTASLVKSNERIASDQRLKGMFAALAQSPTRTALLAVPVALDGARSSLLEGAEALEQALALPVDAPAAAELIAAARTAMAEAVANDADNPLARFYLANALFNQARARQQAGDLESARELMAEFAKQLREAYRLREKRQSDSGLRTEIEGDYALLVRGNVAEAIKLYQRLAGASQGADGDALRHAHWMLAGIFAGDWGVDAQYIDKQQAKQALIQILARWPDSCEARFIRRALRWDDADGGSRFPQFPKENAPLAEMVDHSA
jgi:tetratricopeptide (TPR) repeat protein